MFTQIRPALVILLLLTLVTGVAYPLAVTGAAKLAFAEKAGGSVLVKDGRAIGSGFIGQAFSDPKYFWSRPSATAPVAYAGDAGAGSNLAPTSPALAEAVQKRIAQLRASEPGNTAAVPADLVTSSGSGLDPHTSIAAARYQAARVARVRNLPVQDVEKLIERFTENRTLGVLGEPRVNVLKLNLALDAQ